MMFQEIEPPALLALNQEMKPGVPMLSALSGLMMAKALELEKRPGAPSLSARPGLQILGRQAAVMPLRQGSLRLCGLQPL